MSHKPPIDTDKTNQITEKIIGCTYTMSNTLGSGFLEKGYENALAHELRKAGLKVEQQHSIQVRYDGIVVGISMRIYWWKIKPS